MYLLALSGIKRSLFFEVVRICIVAVDINTFLYASIATPLQKACACLMVCRCHAILFISCTFFADTTFIHNCFFPTVFRLYFGLNLVIKTSFLLILSIFFLASAPLCCALRHCCFFYRFFSNQYSV